MENILIAINKLKPDTASIEFACYIASLSNSKLTGLFIENSIRPSTVSIFPEYYFYSTPQHSGDIASETHTDVAIKDFIQTCTKRNIQCETIVDKGDPLQEIIYESRFADLLLVDPKMNVSDNVDQLPSHFVKEVLANASCPVILTPDWFVEPEEIVFCYDGHSSSLFAIKQFTYLFPQLSEKKVVLLEVNKDGNIMFNDDHRRLIHWLHAHYKTVTFQRLKGEAKDELFTYFFTRSNLFVVMGAYGRSQLSIFFSHSTADVLIRNVDLPLFITHD